MMEILDAIELLSSVGFPIFACIYLAKHGEREEEMHREESREMREALEGLKDAVNSLILRLSLRGEIDEDSK